MNIKIGDSNESIINADDDINYKIILDKQIAELIEISKQTDNVATNIDVIFHE